MVRKDTLPDNAHINGDWHVRVCLNSNLTLLSEYFCQFNQSLKYSKTSSKTERYYLIKRQKTQSPFIPSLCKKKQVLPHSSSLLIIFEDLLSLQNNRQSVNEKRKKL